MEMEIRMCPACDEYRCPDEIITLEAQRDELVRALSLAHAALCNHPGGDNRSDKDAIDARIAIARATGTYP